MKEWWETLDTIVSMLNIFADFIEKINGKTQRSLVVFCIIYPKLAINPYGNRSNFWFCSRNKYYLDGLISPFFRGLFPNVLDNVR